MWAGCRRARRRSRWRWPVDFLRDVCTCAGGRQTEYGELFIACDIHLTVVDGWHDVSVAAGIWPGSGDRVPELWQLAARDKQYVGLGCEAADIVPDGLAVGRHTPDLVVGATEIEQAVGSKDDIRLGREAADIVPDSLAVDRHTPDLVVG